MKIVVLDGYTENPGDLSWDGLKEFGELTVYDRTSREDVIERIADAEIVLTNKTVLDATVFDQCNKLKYVGVLATGYNVVDLIAAKSHGVTVTNIPSYGTSAVAQFVFALLLELCHHVGEHNRSVKSGEWSCCPDFCYWKFPLMELAGKTIGIVGFGRIGQAVSKIAQAFDMNVIYYDIGQEGCSDPRYRELSQLISDSDVITLHCPLTPNTTGIINKETIKKMKPGSFLINTSRGPLVSEKDLLWGLQEGILAGAAVDVVSVEPILENNPLLQEENCIITPHIAWAPKESRERLMSIAVNNIRAYLNGSPENVVG